MNEHDGCTAVCGTTLGNGLIPLRDIACHVVVQEYMAVCFELFGALERVICDEACENQGGFDPQLDDDIWFGINPDLKDDEEDFLTPPDASPNFQRPEPRPPPPYCILVGGCERSPGGPGSGGGGSGGGGSGGGGGGGGGPGDANYIRARWWRDRFDTNVKEKARVYGDPHIATVDGVTWSCMVRGELWYILDSGPMNLQVQIRHIQCGTLGASCAVAVAATEDNVPVLEFDARGGGSLASRLLIDGIPFGGADPDLDVRIFDDLNGLDVTFPSGAKLSIVVFPDVTGALEGPVLSVQFAFPRAFRNDLRGLIGNFNDDKFDDKVTRDGTDVVLTSDDPLIRGLEEDYNVCQTWCTSSSESLFFSGDHDVYDALCGETNFFIPNAEQVAAENETIFHLCCYEISCVIDYFATNSTEFALATRAFVESRWRDDVLEALYDVTSGNFWTSATNWLIGDPCADRWEGVYCASAVGRCPDDTLTEIVVGVQLNRKNLTGLYLPEDLAGLSDLDFLDLGGNNIAAEIPPVYGNFTNLHVLLLESNGLYGEIPPELDQPDLHLVRLDDNFLQGMIPLGWCMEATKPAELYLYHPDACFPDPEFRVFDGNNLCQPPECDTNVIRLCPVAAQEQAALAAIFHLANGLNWDAQAGWLNGDPCHQCWAGITCARDASEFHFKELTGLDLEEQPLNIDLNLLLPSILDLYDLDTLVLRNTGLVGVLPGDLPLVMTKLDLASNNIHGTIPVSYRDLPLDQVFLQGNDLTGPVPWCASQPAILVLQDAASPGSNLGLCIPPDCPLDDVGGVVARCDGALTSPTSEPSATPTTSPSATPSSEPSSEPSATPTISPSGSPSSSEPTPVPTTTSIATFVSKQTGRSSREFFGTQVSTTGDYVAVASRTFFRPGSAYVYERTSPTTYDLEATLGGPANINFGYDVAIDGTVLAVGAANGLNAANVNTGTVSVYRIGEGMDPPRLITTLIPDDGDPGDNFGLSVAASSGPGTKYILVGAALHDRPLSNMGAVYAYRSLDASGESWTLSAKLQPDDGSFTSQFGAAVALDGSIAVIGAQGAAKAYVFQTTDAGVSWTQVTRLLPAQPANLFGRSVAIAGDIVVVGDQRDTPSNDAGGATVYRFDGTWSFVTDFQPTNVAANDNFGISVGVLGDLIAVGAYGDDIGFPDSGTVYLFRLLTNDVDQLDMVTAPDPGESDNFGFDLAIRENVLVVGARCQNSCTGAAYIFSIQDM